MHKVVTLAAALLTVSAVDAQSALPHDDRIRIAEAFRASAHLADGLWHGWSRAPFAVLLVTADREFLIGHPRPSTDFVSVGYDSLLQSDVLTRARTNSPNMLATFPAVGGIPTIVVGQPGATRKSSAAWVVTLLHEHFHQLQMSRPTYYADVQALRLDRGDQTGMWMLNYPFPYDSARTRDAFAKYAGVLADPGATRSAIDSAFALLAATASAEEMRYLTFQMWQEGVARYTEIRAAELLASRFTSSSDFQQLSDYKPYGTIAAELRAQVNAGLRDDPLGRSKRVAFYAAGASAALWLDKADPTWRERYFNPSMVLPAPMR